jgi:hypothetical protein
LEFYPRPQRRFRFGFYFGLFGIEKLAEKQGKTDRGYELADSQQNSSYYHDLNYSTAGQHSGLLCQVQSGNATFLQYPPLRNPPGSNGEGL